MSRLLILSRDAEEDFDRAADSYQREARLGMDFVSRVHDALTRITKTPELYGVVHRDVRCARVRRFP